MKLTRTVEFPDSAIRTLVDDSFDTAYIDPEMAKSFEKSDLVKVTFELLDGRKITYEKVTVSDPRNIMEENINTCNHVWIYVKTNHDSLANGGSYALYECKKCKELSASRLL